MPRIFNTQQVSVSYTHLRAHETSQDLVCRLLYSSAASDVYKRQE
ncbi:hypothetical protein ACX3V1_23105 [Escherichia coli]